jgi:iron complex outermembrane receptor protein
VKHLKLHTLAAAMTLGLGLGHADRAVAQTGAEDADAARLDAVTVTARRREESLQDVPVAVTAFGEEDLRELQARNLDGLQGAVPNVNVVQGRASASSINLFIRGVGQPDALQTFDPAVGVYVDDVYLSRIQGALTNMFDVERVEVLRGPQGTLYGRNTAGGALKVITRVPGYDPQLDVEVTAGDFGRVEGRFYGTGAASDSVSFSLAGLYADNDGYVRDPSSGRRFNDNGEQALRAKLVARPSDAVSLTFSADYIRQDNELALGRAEAPLVQVDLALGPQVLVPAPTGRFDYRARTELGPDKGQELDHWGVSGVLEWAWSDSLTFKSITAHRNLETDFWIDFDATARQLTSARVALDQRQVSQEFQLQYDNRDNLRAVYGLYYLSEKVPSHQEAYANDFLALAGTPIDFLRTIDDDLRNRSYAAFFNLSYDFGNDWSLSGGLRYTEEKKDYFRTTSTFSTVLPALNGTFAFDADATFSALTPSLALQRRFGDRSMGYISANRGFKSGGFNGRANSPGEVSIFDPEYVWTYELGYKASSSDGRLVGNLALFHSDYKDFQARIAEVVDPTAAIPTFTFPVLNAAKLRIQGIEFEGAALIGDGTRLSGNLGFQDARYREFFDDRFAGGDRSGDKVPFSPKWNARLALTHTFALASGAAFTLGGDISYRDKTWLSVDNREVLTQDAYSLVGLFGVWESGDRNWRVQAGVRNATDKVYKVDAQEFSSVGNIQTAYYGWPRHAYLSARYSFR